MKCKEKHTIDCEENHAIEQHYHIEAPQKKIYTRNIPVTSDMSQCLAAGAHAVWSTYPGRGAM